MLYYSFNSLFYFCFLKVTCLVYLLYWLIQRFVISKAWFCSLFFSVNSCPFFVIMCFIWNFIFWNYLKITLKVYILKDYLCLFLSTELKIWILNYFFHFTQCQEQKRHALLTVLLLYNLFFPIQPKKMSSLRALHHLWAPTSSLTLLRCQAFPPGLLRPGLLKPKAYAMGSAGPLSANGDFKAQLHLWICASLSFVTFDYFSYFTSRSALL